jgi:putative ABC transport system permease protein
MRRTPAWVQSLVLRVYAAVLRLYPRAFRRACGAPMLETFEGLCRERAAQHGAIGFLAACAPDVADALGCAWRARRPPADPVAAASVARENAESTVAALWQDVGRGVRRLRAQPALVTFVVLTLGFAIAANAALFSIVDAVLLRPSPFTAADRLVHVLNVAPRGFTYPGLNGAKLRQWRGERDIFDAVEAYRATPLVVTGDIEPQEVQAAQISPGLAAMLGVPPRHGRLFVESDILEGQPPVALVSERFWRAHLGGDPSAIGRSLTIQGRTHEVIGVMPARFHFPSLQQQIWLPLDPTSGTGGPSTTIARLRAGLTAASAQARIDTVAARLEEEQPIPSGWNIRLTADTIATPPEQMQRAVLILFGAVGLLLLTACANVANVLLSRAVDRRREFAIRLALGAGRGRLARELIIEGALLGALAGAAGLLAAHWSLETLVRLAPDNLTFVTTTPIAVDMRVAGFGVLLALLTGIVCNLPPVLRVLRASGADALSGRTASASATPTHRRMRGALVVLEVALSVMLLVGAALLARSFTTLNAIDLGFEPDGLLAVGIGLDTERYDTPAGQAALLDAVAERVARLPGVEGVAISSGLPPNAGEMSLAWLETDAGTCGDDPVGVVSTLVTPAYFTVARVRVVDGRPLQPDDPREAVVMSRAVARHCGLATIVGRRVRLGPNAPWLTVVGMTADVKALGLKTEQGDLSVYSAFEAGTFLLPNLAVRAGDTRFATRRLIVRTPVPEALVPEVKRALWAIAPDQPVLSAGPASDLMADTIRSERFMLTLMALFSAVALALASAGIFGVLAYAVAQRTRELGIRMAFGATPGSVLGLVVGQAMTLSAAGIGLGALGAFVLSRFLAGLLYEVDPRDPAAFALIATLVTAVALAACAVPALRACRIDPATALRDE